MFVNFAIKLSKAPALGVLCVVLSSGALAADERPNPRDVGSYLGKSISCGCLAYDPDFLAAFYYAVFAEDYDQSYAEAMSGEMRYNANQVWRNQASLCAKICPSEIMSDMAYLVEHAERAMTSPVFRGYFDEALARYSPGGGAGGEGNYANWQMCYWRPNSPICQDIDDPSGPVGAQVMAEDVPECSATQDLIAGVGCEGRQKGRMSGF